MNKIIHRFQLNIIYSIVFLLTPVIVVSQTVTRPIGDSLLNKYGLRVLHSLNELKRTVAKDGNNQMTDLKKQIPSLVLDLRYAGTNNFMKEKLYPPITTTWLRKPAVDSLIKIQRQLKEMGLGLKIFDAYRPYSVTEKMWEPVQDDRYAADPKKGSGHNRGIAVDLTIVNLKTGEELNMGTGFDNFTDSAHHAFTNLPEEILQNRLLLKKIMEQHGFRALDTEWWHYSLPNAKDFDLLDINFNDLNKKNTNNERKFNRNF
ncbi:M15 family metallopeptidase [Ferruginibacter sp. SUN106]|uniref:M15 family metallopeptidase n=1 Tax=Ferruginibacter sp. SUN106 TaxID=2978348 RepID=UPI003D36A873